MAIPEQVRYIQLRGVKELNEEKEPVHKQRRAENTITMEVLMSVAKSLLTSFRPNLEEIVVTLVEKAANKDKSNQPMPRIIGLCNQSDCKNISRLFIDKLFAQGKPFAELFPKSVVA